MKILVTGADGFIGKNLISELRNRGYQDIFCCDKDTPPEMLDRYCGECSFVFHLAGVNRPQNVVEFMQGNRDFTDTLIVMLEQHRNFVPILMSSSIQAELQNPYGESKRAGESLVRAYGERNKADIYVYRFPNVFGKWCRPNYNSVVATFCYNISRGLPIQVNDPERVLELVYIDDLVEEIVRAINGCGNRSDNGFYFVPIQHEVKLSKLSELLYSFQQSRRDLSVPDMSDSFIKKLWATYLSYLPESGFSYPLVAHTDPRGSFTEFLKTENAGQVSVNISKPGITKGNHWHQTKNEKFLVVSGQGVIRFRKIGSEPILSYPVSAEHLVVVDIPPGYTHNIENTGSTDMITIMWASECFDPQKPDTYCEEV